MLVDPPRRVIAEFGSCGGDLQLALDTAAAAVEAGAWMVKGQGYSVERLVTRGVPGYGDVSLDEPVTQWEAFEKALTIDEWAQVEASVERFGLSIFDPSWLEYPWQWVKIASGDITWQELIEAAGMSGAQLIISTGASSVHEIARAVAWAGKPDIVLACTLTYPCPLEDAHVARVGTLRPVAPMVGYSDHTRGIQAATVAFDVGADVVEKHFTIRPGTGGDNNFAIGPDELYTLVYDPPQVDEETRRVILGDPTLEPRPSESAARHLARRGVYTAVDLPAGTVIRRDHLTILRPAADLEPWVLGTPESPVGQIMQHDAPAGVALTRGMFGRVRFTLTVT
jgi:sialic acid synthase SpsE